MTTTDNVSISKSEIVEAFSLMAQAKSMSELYEREFKTVSKYVHATSRGHEAIQIAIGKALTPDDFVGPYYRDDALLLALGMRPYELMLQLLAKRDDPFSGGRTYYSHPSLNRPDIAKIPHQSSATGMQAIPMTGVAMGLRYRTIQSLADGQNQQAIAVCSLGDASVTEGEVSEAFQMAVLKKLPIIYLVQDNGWDISAYKDEVRAMDAYEYAQGFKGLEAVSIDGSDYLSCHRAVRIAVDHVRSGKGPYLLHAHVPLLNHHTSGVRKEWYRDDLEEQQQQDPYPKIRKLLADYGHAENDILRLERGAREQVDSDFKQALTAEDPRPEDLEKHIFKPTPITTESGSRVKEGATETVMVDCALLAIKEIMAQHPESLLYGQDVGARLGGVFREAATLAQAFGDERVFNTPIQEAFIIGSTVGMAAVGLKPIVEVQFADYIWPGLNQLFTEVSRSYYLSNGQWPVSMVLRVPIGAYGSGGPYHSSSVESVVAQIKGVKIAYPSNGADLKGIMKAAYYDPNPVVIFEHKGLYWSKVPGTDYARSLEPADDYVYPLGKSKIVQHAEDTDQTVTVVTYGMGVHWALGATKKLGTQQVEIIDLVSLNPLDLDTVYDSVLRTHRCIVITEETIDNSMAQSIAARIQENCWTALDAPVITIGSVNTPAIPLNSTLEQTMLLNADKVMEQISMILNY